MSRGLQRLLVGLAVVAMSSALLTSPASAAKPSGGGRGKKAGGRPPAEVAAASTVGTPNGRFTCRAALARLEGAGLLSGVHAELFRANPAGDPCVTDFSGIQASVNAEANLFTHTLLLTDLLKVDVQVLYGGTQLLVDNQFTPALPVAGMAEAGVALLKISVLGVAIEVAVLTSEAEAFCSNGLPDLRGRSKVVGLKIDGAVQDLGLDVDVSLGQHLHAALAATLAAQLEVQALLGHLLAPAELDLLLQAGLTLHLNHQEKVVEGDGGKLTQQALVLESGLIGKVIVSESIADYHGNPCTTTTGPPPPPPPPSAGRGWMTGGGRINSTTAGKVTHGFRLECTPANGGNNLQVSYAGGGFHATGELVATCDNGSDLQNDSGNPKAAFDTLVGSARGRCNGQDALATYTLTDRGEPGSADTFRIDITGAPGCALSASGALERGNHQAHGRP